MTDATAGGEGCSVIAFPMSRARLAEVRLWRALAALQRAADQQATELAAWRETLTQLDRRLAGLAGSVDRSRATPPDDVGAAGGMDPRNPRAMPAPTR